MLTGVFPKNMKKTTVIPLYKKKGSKSDPANYRPIALITPFSKISEKIFLKRVLSFLNANDVLAKNQYGYKEGISCVDTIIKLIVLAVHSFLHKNLANCDKSMKLCTRVP
jgi:hypothetical protein